jgi:predicted nucleic acid-binding protein
VAEVVADASVLSALFLHEEGSERIREAIHSETSIFSSSFWRFEVSNAIWKRKDLPFRTAQSLIEIIWRFQVSTWESPALALKAFSIAKKHGITFYDSFYIAMAEQMGIPLWTLDGVQSKAAVKEGVHLWKR